MPNFNYTCINQEGVKVKGTESASNLESLETILKKDGMWLIDAEIDRQDQSKISKSKVTTRELIDFFVQLFAMLKAGVSIIDALNTVSSEIKNLYFKGIVGNIVIDIESGKAFEDSVAEYPDVFDKLCVNAIKSGTASGRIDKSLEHLISHYEWTENIKGHIKKAGLYPIMLSVSIVAFTFGMFTFVVPKFVTLLTSFHVALPLPTRVMFSVNNFFSDYSIYLGIAFIGSIFLISFLKKTNEKFLYMFDKLKLKVPIFGIVNEMIVVSRFLHTLSALLKSGILIVDALEIAVDSIGNKYFEVEMNRVISDVTNGERLATSISNYDIFKPMVRNMIYVGEESGNLEEILDYIYQYYDKEVPKRVDIALAVMTQVVTIVLGAIVALIAFAVFLPMMDMTQALKHR